MPAYLIVEHIITDAAKFEEYRTRVAPMSKYRPLIALRKQCTSELDMLFTLEGA